MIPAFWDASALVPLCVQQKQSSAATHMRTQHEITVWWGTPVEVRSAFERLLRMGKLSGLEHKAAGMRLEILRQGWRELQPSDLLRSHAEIFLIRHTLRAADALQLAAAWTWCQGVPQHHTFICGDIQLMQAARRVGFQVEVVS